MSREDEYWGLLCLAEEQRDKAEARVKELEESIKLYRGAIVESGDLKRENANLRRVLVASEGVIEWMKGFQYHKKFPEFVEAVACVATVNTKGV